MEEFSYVLAKNFVAFVPVCLYFFTAAHFHLADRSLLTTTVSHFLTAAMKFSCLSSNETGSVVFNHSLKPFLCYSRECILKHIAEKDSTLLLTMRFLAK